MRRRPDSRLVILILLLLLVTAGAGYLAGRWNCGQDVATGPAKPGEQAAPAPPPRAAAAALAMARDEAGTGPRGRIERKYDRQLAARRKERYERACDTSAQRAASEACRNVEDLIGELRESRARELAALEQKSGKAVAGKKAAPRLPKLAMRAPRKKPEAPRKRKFAKEHKTPVRIDESRKAAVKPATGKNTVATGTESAPAGPSAIPNEEIAAVDAAHAESDGARVSKYDGRWVGEWDASYGSMIYCDPIMKGTIDIKNGKITGVMDNNSGGEKISGIVKEDGSFYLNASHPQHEFTAQGKIKGNKLEGEFDQTFCGGTVVYHRKPAAARAKPADTGKTRAVRRPGEAPLAPEKQLAAADPTRAISDAGEKGPYDGEWVGEWSTLYEYTGGGTYCETTAKSIVTVKNGKISGWLNNGEADQKITGVVKEDGSFYLSASHPLLGYTAQGKFKGNKVEGEFDRNFCAGTVVYRRKTELGGH